METYWGLHADKITLKIFWSFAWRRRKELAAYLKWAARMESSGGFGRQIR
jgi:lysine/ornithine N-monooxygenase